MKKTLLLLAIASFSQLSLAQSSGSNPNPFNTTPIVKGGDTNEKPDNRTSNRDSRNILDKEIERRRNTPKTGRELIEQESNNMMDRANLPDPIDLPELPLPKTFEDMYRGVEDFRVKGKFNDANLEYSSNQNVYRITGNSFKELPSKKENLTIKRKEDNNGYELTSGGKEPSINNYE